MQAVFNKLGSSWRNRFEGSEFQRFLIWWRDELLSMLPVKIASILSHQPAKLFIEKSASGINLFRIDGAQKELVSSIELSEDPKSVRQTLSQLLAGFDKDDLQLVALAPADQVLLKEMTLPIATEENLRQVLAFEMDRQTPFKDDEVYYDQQIVRRDRARNQIHVQMLLSPRTKIDEWIELMKQRGIHPHSIDVCPNPEEPGTVAGFNLLPIEHRQARNHGQSRLNFMILVGLFILSGVLMANTLATRQEDLDEFTELVAATKKQAFQIAKLKKELDDAAVGADFLVDKKYNHPSLTEILFRLTQLIPENTYIQRLQLKNSELQLQGQSDDASSLIGLMEASEWFEEVDFRSPVTKDNKTNKDRFNIEAQVKVAAFRDLENQMRNVPLPKPEEIDEDVLEEELEEHEALDEGDEKSTHLTDENQAIAEDAETFGNDMEASDDEASSQAKVDQLLQQLQELDVEVDAEATDGNRPDEEG